MSEPTPASASQGHSQAQSQKQAQRPGPGLDYAYQQDLIRALHQVDQPEQAARLARCGRKIERVNPDTGEVEVVRQEWCGLSICKVCGRVRASKRTRAQMAKVARIQALDQQHRESLATKRPAIQQAFLDVEAAVKGLPGERGRLTQAKKELRHQLQALRGAVWGLEDEWVDTASTRHWLKLAIRSAKSGGVPDTPALLAHLRFARQCLADAIGLRLSYGWWALTVTKTTYHESYRDQVEVMKKVNFKELLAHLAAPGVGVIAVIHTQDNLNEHALCFRPPLEEAKLKQLWHTITGDSDQVKVEKVYAVEGWLRYMNSPPENVLPEKRVAHQKDTRGMQLVAYYGVLNSRSLRKRCQEFSPPDGQAEAGGLGPDQRWEHHPREIDWATRRPKARSLQASASARFLYDRATVLETVAY